MSKTSHLRQLYSYARPHMRGVYLGIGALLVVNAIGVFLPWFVKIAIDNLGDLVQEGGLDSLRAGGRQVAFYAIVLLVVATLRGVIRTASRVWMFGAGRQVEFELKQAIFDHLLSLPPSYFGQQSAGDLINRSTSDVDNIRRLLGFAILSLFNTIFAYSMIFPAMMATDLPLSLVAISVYPVMLVLVSVTSERLRNQQATVQNRLSRMSELIQEDMNGISLIKVYGQEANEREEFRQRNQALLDANIDLALTRNILFPALTALAGTSLLLLLVVGGPRIASGVISLGDFTQLTLYVEQLVFPTALLGFTITAYQRGQVSLERLQTILGTEPTIRDADTAISIEPLSIQGRLQARALTFSYPDDPERPALNNISFSISPGETVAIVGPIGSGKTTLANAIPHLLEIERDRLFLDDIDITRIQLKQLRQAIAYVPQESFLFGATVRDNIRYGKPDARDWDVEAAAKAARIHSEIVNFPKQYDTIVGERGITLSGGQRQRVALARALLTDAPILVLDDSLSSVDNQTAQHILGHLSGDTRTKTVLFISHRLTAAAKADRILVMARGTIVQEGSHQRLLEQYDGLYSKLWHQQKLETALTA
ncbi:MAG: ABC transporter ATP-binding protein [Cyanobacteria bacterium P01_E01_bin.34]